MYIEQLKKNLEVRYGTMEKASDWKDNLQEGGSRLLGGASGAALGFAATPLLIAAIAKNPKLAKSFAARLKDLRFGESARYDRAHKVAEEVRRSFQKARPLENYEKLKKSLSSEVERISGGRYSLDAQPGGSSRMNIADPINNVFPATLKDTKRLANAPKLMDRLIKRYDAGNMAHRGLHKSMDAFNKIRQEAPLDSEALGEFTRVGTGVGTALGTGLGAAYLSPGT